MLIKTDLLFSPANQTRRLHLWLPDDYGDSDERYPVMYMFDGQNLFYDSDATYGKSWGMAPFLSGWEKKIIVAGMECSHEGNGRLGEYCPYDFSNDWAGDVHGTGKATMDWFVDELKPYIDANYRTWAHREATGIGGSSMGGLMAFYAAVAYNNVFSKAACVSSALGFCYRQIKTLAQNSDLAPDTKIYLSWGTREARYARGKAIMTNENKALNDIVWKKGAQPYLNRQTNGGHCEADWEKQVPLLMNWLWR